MKMACGCIVSKVGATWYFDNLCKTHANRYFEQHQAKELHDLLNLSLRDADQIMEGMAFDA